MAGEAKKVTKRSSLFLNEHNVAPFGSNVTLGVQQAALDASNYESVGDFAEELSGLKSATFDVTGHLMSGDLERHLWNTQKGTGNVMSFSDQKPILAGDIVYFAQGEVANFAPSFPINNIAAFNASLRHQGGIVQGYGLSDVSADAAAGPTAGLEVDITKQWATGVPNGQLLKAFLHVTRVIQAGTLDVIVQSAAATGMASPVTRITFAQVTAVGAQLLEVSGPITDRFYQSEVTIGGGGEFEYKIGFGVI